MITLKTNIENRPYFNSFQSLAHSCRAASTSKAMSVGVSLENILNAAQWSKESTFYKFYCKDIVTSGTSANSDFALGVLDTI